MKDLYKTGKNTWSNLTREIKHNASVWERSDTAALDRNAQIQFSLYQTAEAVQNLGGAYQMMGEQGKQAFDGVVNSMNLFKDAIQLSTGAPQSVTETMQSNAQAFSAIGNFRNLSSNQLRALANQTTGIFGAQGILG